MMSIAFDRRVPSARGALLSLFAVAGLAAVQPVLAQKAGDAWPARPLRLIIPASPGGGADTLARVMTARLSERFGQPVVTDNRPGAAGTIAMDITARSAPDGYTSILTQSTSAVIAPAIYEKMSYRTLVDFTPVSLIAEVPHVLVVNPTVPANNLKELIALAKARSLNYASSGIGAGSHFSGEMLDRAAGIRTTHLPYKGAGPALAAVISGEAQLFSSPINAAMGQIKAGKLRPIAMTTAKRSAVLPDLPTIAESGYPGYEASTFNAVLAPAAVPSPIVSRMHGAIVAAVKFPELRNRMGELGIELMANASPEEATAFVRSEVARMARLVKDAGIKPD